VVRWDPYLDTFRLCDRAALARLLRWVPKATWRPDKRAWLVPLAGNVDSLFGLQGWFDRQAYAEAARLAGGSPRPIGWSVLYLCGSNGKLLTLAYVLSLGVIALFTVGVWTRLTGVLTWVVVASFTANPVLAYEADPLLLMLAFYLMLGHVLEGQRAKGLSLAARLLGTRGGWPFGGSSPATVARPSLGAALALRLLQVHFAIVMAVGGLQKLQFGDWWSGVAFWYPLHPPLEASFDAIRADAAGGESFLFVLGVAAYATLVWQIGFPLFAWRPRWRLLLLGGSMLGWMGTAFLYRLPLLGPAVFVGCLSYVTAAAWHRLVDLLARVPGLRQMVSWVLAAPGRPGAPGMKPEQAAFLVPVGHR